MRFLLFLLLFLNIAFSEGVPSNPAHRFTDEEKILLLLSELEQRWNRKEVYLFSLDYKDENGTEYKNLKEIFSGFFGKCKDGPIIYFENPKVRGEGEIKRVKVKVWLLESKQGENNFEEMEVVKEKERWKILQAKEVLEMVRKIYRRF